MNMNQITNMIIRLFMRKAINTGINSGIRAMNGKGRKPPQNVVEANGHPMQPDGDKPQLTQAEVRDIRRARRERKAIRQARQAAKLARHTSQG